LQQIWVVLVVWILTGRCLLKCVQPLESGLGGTHASSSLFDLRIKSQMGNLVAHLEELVDGPEGIAVVVLE
jgi:hypothetical protein